MAFFCAALNSIHPFGLSSSPNLCEPPLPIHNLAVWYIVPILFIIILSSAKNIYVLYINTINRVNIEAGGETDEQTPTLNRIEVIHLNPWLQPYTRRGF